jgi:hypothetical protein
MTSKDSPTIKLSKDRIDNLFECLRKQPNQGIYSLIKPVLDEIKIQADIWLADETKRQHPASQIEFGIMLSVVALGAHHFGDKDLSIVCAAQAEKTLVASQYDHTNKYIVAAIIFAQLCTTQGHTEKSQMWLVDIAPELFQALRVHRLFFLKELNINVTKDDELGVVLYSSWVWLLSRNGSLDSPQISQYHGYQEALRLLNCRTDMPDVMNLQLVSNAFQDGVLVGTDKLVERLLSVFHGKYQQYHPIIPPSSLNGIHDFTSQLLRSNMVARASFNNFYCSFSYCILALGSRFAGLNSLFHHFRIMFKQHVTQPVGNGTWTIILSIMAAWLLSDCREEASRWLQEAITGISNLLVTTSMSDMDQQHLRVMLWSCHTLRRYDVIHH